MLTNFTKLRATIIVLMTILAAWSCEKKSTTYEDDIEPYSGDGQTLTQDSVLSWEVLPQDPYIAKGETIQLVVTAVLIEDPSKKVDITNSINWNIPEQSNLEPFGDKKEAKFIGKKEGTTLVTGYLNKGDTKTISLVIEVGPKELRSIRLTPDVNEIPIGTDHEYDVHGVYSDGTFLNIGGSSTVESANEEIITGKIQNQKVRIEAFKLGLSSLIFTTSDGDELYIDLTVKEVGIYDIEIEPPTRVLPTGAELEIDLIGYVSDNSEISIEDGFLYESSDPQVLRFEDGKLIADKSGTATIEMVYEGITRRWAYTVSNSNYIKDIKIQLTDDPDGLNNLPKGKPMKFSAYAVLSNGQADIDISPHVDWTSVDQDGKISITKEATYGSAISRELGNAIISAEYLGIKGSLEVLGVSAVAEKLEVLPEKANVNVGDSGEQFTASLVYTDGTKTDVTNDVTWNISNYTGGRTPPLIGDETDVNKGLILDNPSSGTSTIAAFYSLDSELFSDESEFVSQSAITTVEITINNDDTHPPDMFEIKIANGLEQYLQAEAVYANGARENITGDVVWYVDYYSSGYGNHGFLARNRAAPSRIPFVTTSMGRMRVIAEFQGLVAEREILIDKATIAKNGLVCVANQTRVVTGNSTEIECSATLTDGEILDADMIDQPNGWDVSWTGVRSSSATFPGSGALNDYTTAKPSLGTGDIGYITTTATIDEGSGRTAKYTVDVMVAADCGVDSESFGGQLNNSDNLFCWRLGELGESCNEVCTGSGGVYLNATRVYGENQGKCDSLRNTIYDSNGRIEDTSGSSGERDSNGLGCTVNEWTFLSFQNKYYFPPVRGAMDTTTTQQELRRYCSCNN